MILKQEPFFLSLGALSGHETSFTSDESSKVLFVPSSRLHWRSFGEKLPSLRKFPFPFPFELDQRDFLIVFSIRASLEHTHVPFLFLNEYFPLSLLSSS